MRRFAFVLLLSVSGLAAPSVAPRAGPVMQVPLVPHATLLVDGQIEAREWSDAASIALGDDSRLYLGRVDDAVRLALTEANSVPRVVDIFVRTESGKLWQFHASMSLGERDLTPYGKPVDEAPWVWNVHSGWQANRAHIDASKARELPFAERLLPREGVEFEWLRGRFEGDSVLMHIQIGSFTGSAPERVYPPESRVDNQNSWLRLELSRRE